MLSYVVRIFMGTMTILLAGGLTAAHAQFPFGGGPGSETSIWGDNFILPNGPVGSGRTRTSSQWTYDDELYGKGGYSSGFVTNYEGPRNIHKDTMLVWWNTPTNASGVADVVYITTQGYLMFGIHGKEVEDTDAAGWRWQKIFPAWFFAVPPVPGAQINLDHMPVSTLQEWIQRIDTYLQDPQFQNTTGAWGIKDLWYRDAIKTMGKLRARKAEIALAIQRTKLAETRIRNLLATQGRAQERPSGEEASPRTPLLEVQCSELESISVVERQRPYQNVFNDTLSIPIRFKISINGVEKPLVYTGTYRLETRERFGKNRRLTITIVDQPKHKDSQWYTIIKTHTTDGSTTWNTWKNYPITR